MRYWPRGPLQIKLSGLALADNWHADKANNENDNDSRVQSNVVRECPVRIIRESVGGQEIYLGDIGLVK